VLALYLALRDDPARPYRSETFLNPAEAAGPQDDATSLGQNLALQLARQEYTYLIFVDEQGDVLLNRRLAFDAETRANLAAAAAQAQASAYAALASNQPLGVEQFEAAARWHIARFPLDRIRA
jgi:hypothetical protein